MLSDLLVLELASVLAGPSVGQFFAELGATVVKVENTRTGGDVTRRWKLPTEPEEGDVSGYFASCNFGKRSLALNLRVPEGRAVLHALAEKSDIVLASYKPGDAEKLGADYETLAALNPGLLYAHLTGYGLDDPRPGYDAVIQAESGFMYMNGTPDGPPIKMPVALMDVLAAHQLKEALLLALLRRERTGEGAYITVSLLESAVSALVNQASNWLNGGVIPQRKGSEHPNIAPYGTVYRTADGKELVLAVGTDRQFAALCRILGLEALPVDLRFADNTARVCHRTFLNDLLQASIGSKERDVLLEELKAANVPAGAVNDLRDVFALPRAAAMVLRMPEAPNGPVGLRQAAFLPDSPSYLSPAPSYGADTEPLLRKLLGFTSDDLHRLRQAGALPI